MESGGFQEYNTFAGQFKLYFSRLAKWAWLLVPLAFFGALLLGFIVIGGRKSETLEPEIPTPEIGVTKKPLLYLGAGPEDFSDENSKDADKWENPTGNGTSPGDASNLHNGTFLFRPLNEPEILHLYTTLYLGLEEIQKVYLRKLEVRKIIIDAAMLSDHVRDAPNLETVILEAVGISGDFSRVFVPKMKDFTVNQLGNSRRETFRTLEALQNILFFDLEQGKSFNLLQDLLNINVNVKISVAGTTMLEVNRGIGLVNLNVKFCEDILKNMKPGGEPITTLTLTECTITNPQILPLSTLNHINLINAVPDEDNLSEIIRGATQLESFNALSVNPEHSAINLTDFSETVRTVSISKLTIHSLPENYVSTITNLTLEEVTVTDILGNFNKNFANLNKVAVLKATSVDDGYKLLEEILKTPATWILMMDFSRNSTYTSIESFLTSKGIPTGERNFLIEKNETSGIYTGVSISDFFKHFNRYNLLKFNDMETYQDYSIWDAVYD